MRSDARKVKMGDKHSANRLLGQRALTVQAWVCIALLRSITERVIAR
jgi:hypothetical protein